MAEEMVRPITQMDPAALWLGVSVVGLTAVFVGYIGVVLVAALIAETPEAQRYRSRLLRELLRFLRDMFRGRSER
jgi:hypothetical protein